MQQVGAFKYLITPGPLGGDRVCNIFKEIVIFLHLNIEKYTNRVNEEYG